MPIAKSFYIDSKNITIEALTYGDPRNPIIFALHGWLDNAASFDLLAPLLKDYYVIAIDLPGHGLSTMPEHKEPFDFHYFISLFNDLTQQITDKPFVLMGHSLGGALSTLFATHEPTKVSKLILIDALGPLSADMLANNQTLQTNVKKMQAAAQFASEKVYPNKDMMLQIRVKANQVSEQKILPLVERGVKAIDGGFVWRYDKHITETSAFYYAEKDVLALLEKIHCPILILAGTNGIFAGRPFYQERLKHLANHQIEFIEAHHHLHLEKANVCASNILDFLS